MLLQPTDDLIDNTQRSNSQRPIRKINKKDKTEVSMFRTRNRPRPPFEFFVMVSRKDRPRPKSMSRERYLSMLRVVWENLEKERIEAYVALAKSDRLREVKKVGSVKLLKAKGSTKKEN